MIKIDIKNKKQKIILIVTAAVLAVAIAVATVVFGINHYVKATAKPYIFSELSEAGEGYDCILILGCKVVGDEPSHMLEDRLSVGVDLYFLEAAEKLLMSGDHGSESYDEVSAMKKYAVENGVPSEDVFLDHAGFSTYDSVYRAREIFGAGKVLIVTQEYHLYRAVYLARTLGLDAYGVSSDLRSYRDQYKNELREILARNKDFFKAMVKPEPTYLGEKISLDGDGDITNGKT